MIRIAFVIGAQDLTRLKQSGDVKKMTEEIVKHLG